MSAPFYQMPTAPQADASMANVQGVPNRGGVTAVDHSTMLAPENIYRAAQATDNALVQAAAQGRMDMRQQLEGQMQRETLAGQPLPGNVIPFPGQPQQQPQQFAPQQMQQAVQQQWQQLQDQSFQGAIEPPPGQFQGFQPSPQNGVQALQQMGVNPYFTPPQQPVAYSNAPGVPPTQMPDQGPQAPQQKSEISELAAALKAQVELQKQAFEEQQRAQQEWQYQQEMAQAQRWQDPVYARWEMASLRLNPDDPKDQEIYRSRNEARMITQHSRYLEQQMQTLQERLDSGLGQLKTETAQQFEWRQAEAQLATVPQHLRPGVESNIKALMKAGLAPLEATKQTLSLFGPSPVPAQQQSQQEQAMQQLLDPRKRAALYAVGLSGQGAGQFEQAPNVADMSIDAFEQMFFRP